jgi:predicted outer membrane repeat protein
MKKAFLFVLFLTCCNSVFAAVFPIPNGNVAALIEAINTANTNNEPDVINLATNGSYILTAVNYTSLNPGSTGNEGQRGLPNIANDVTGLDLTINGNGATIQRSTSAPNFGLFSCQGQTVFNNLTLRSANVNAQGAAIFVQYVGNVEVNDCSFYDNTSLLNAEGGGGAIYTKTASVLTVRNSYFENNVAVNQGGAISNLLSNLTVLNCTFKNNKTTSQAGAAGGAIYNDGARGDSGVIIIRNTLFEGNTSTGLGGALFLFPYRNESAEVTGCTFKTNSANQGGAFWHSAGGFLIPPGSAPEYPFTSGPENTTLLFNNCVFDGNTAGYIGGGIWLGNCIVNEIHSCTFKNNKAQSGGGAVLSTNRAFTFRNSTFNNNTADRAGAIAAVVNAKLTIQNCTFDANIASEYGGALSVPQNGTPIDIINCTFANNQANRPGNGQSGAIHSGDSNQGNGTVMIKNNIFYNQTVTNPWGVWKNCNSVLNDGGNNLFFPENSDGRCVATPDNSLFVNPLLSPLADNGGPTQTMALQVGSPAINAGNGCPEFDQRGSRRTGPCDIGAYEYNGMLTVQAGTERREGVVVYPNPASGEFFLALPKGYEGKTATVRLYSLTGQLVLEKTLDKNQLNALRLTEKGMYILKTTVDKQHFTNKVSIQ